MAFTSIGYDGSVNEKQWAELVPSVGAATYGVKEADDLKVSAVAGQALTVSVASGAGWGHGVLDTETANTTVACEALSSGTRWDLIALRRNWQPLAGGPTSVVAISGTSTKELPSTRLIVPGVEDDQPLALVQWSSTQTQPADIIDLRCWAGNGGLVAKDDLVRTFMLAPATRIHINGTEWVRRPGDNDSLEWVSLDSANLTSDVQAIGPGWTALTGNHKPRLVRQGRMVYLFGGIVQGTAASVINMLTIPVALRPANAGTMFIGSGVTSKRVAYELLLANGIVTIDSDYITASFPVGSVVPVVGSWPLY
jgi:hypothetical protein